MIRTLTSLALMLICLGAALTPVYAQEIKDRQLQPYFDLTQMQMPIEITAIKLNGKEVRPGEKIQGDDDWLQGLSFTVKNISDKPLAYVALGLRFPQPQGFVVFGLNYGVNFSIGEPRRTFSPPAIEPGATVDMVLTKERYPMFLRILDIAGAARSFDVAPYYVQLVCFEGEPDIIWEGGMLKQRVPGQLHEFKTIERYALPVRREKEHGS